MPGIDVSMYAPTQAQPAQANNLLQLLSGGASSNPLQNLLLRPGSAAPGLAQPSAAPAPMQARVPADRQNVANTVADELRTAGLSENGIRGILANVQDESDFDPTLRGADQPKFSGEAHFAHGLYQEGGSEWNNYSGWLDKTSPGADWRDPRLQTRFLAQNLQQNYPDVWKTLNGGTPEAGAQSFLSGYLKPRADYLATRSAKYGQGVPDTSAYTGNQNDGG